MNNPISYCSLCTWFVVLPPAMLQTTEISEQQSVGVSQNGPFRWLVSLGPRKPPKGTDSHLDVSSAGGPPPKKMWLVVSFMG